MWIKSLSFRWVFDWCLIYYDRVTFRSTEKVQEIKSPTWPQTEKRQVRDFRKVPNSDLNLKKKEH